MLFDNRDDSSSENEEVSISPARNSGSSSGNQRDETEIRGKASSSRDEEESSNSGGGISIPSAEGDGSAVDESKVSLEDIHEQNKKIIGLLESISDSDSKDTSDDESDQLKGDIENELL
jgi:hypothetical protein